MHYLDHAATTPVSQSVQQMIAKELMAYGNPSSTYRIGREQKQKIQKIKKQILSELSADSTDSIIFTGSGSEANNLVFESVIQQFSREKGHLMISAIEHPSVKKAAYAAEQLGFEVSEILPDSSGMITVEAVEAALRPDTRLVSVMMVNNETGVRQPIQEIGLLLKDQACYFHTDAVQAFTQEEIAVDQLHIDYLSASGHKINVPKGIGFLYRNHQVPLHALIKGGGQEDGWRAGTENVPYMMGLSVGIEEAVQTRKIKNQHFVALQQYLFEQLTNHAIAYEVNGSVTNKSPHICNLWLKGIPASQALIVCDLGQVAISAGSACSAGSLEPSPVLTAMFPEQVERVQQSIRLSFGLETTFADIDAFIAALSSIKR